MKLVSFLVTSFVVVAGCSNSTTTAYGNTDAFCAAWAHEDCQKAPGLCAVSQSACETARKAACQQFATEQSTGSRTYKSDNAQACLDKRHDGYGHDPVTAQDIEDMNAVCKKVFKGTTKEFATCSGSGQANHDADNECEGDLICDKGLCATKVVKSSGQPCGNPGEVCDDSSYCAQNSAGNVFVCQPKGQSGQPCDAVKSPCVSDLRCDVVCVAKQAAGAPCSSDTDCGSDAPYCDVDNGSKCDAGLRFGSGTTCSAYGGT